MNFSENQRKILAFPNTDYDALICDGAIRSGKTTIMSVAFVLWAMREFNGCCFGICSKTVRTAEKNIIQPLLNLSYMKKRFSMKYTRDNELVVRNRDKVNTFYIYGGKDASSYTLIQGATFAGVLLDEVALMPRSFVEQACARCSVDGRKLWFNCNPEGQLHWFNQEWVKKTEEKNALHVHFTLDDNPSLSPRIRAGYEAMYSGVFYDRYIKGLWVSADGLVYGMFNEKRHVVEEPPETEGSYYISSDFGVQNPTVFLLWRKVKDRDQWIILNEWYYSGRENKVQKTVGEQVKGLESLFPVEYGRRIEPAQIIVDPSASALIAEIREEGHTVRKANNDVVDGISDVSTMLVQDRLLISRKCKHTIEEFQVYCWDEKAAMRGEDKPVKENDHCMDAIRYMVKTRHLARVDEEYIPVLR